MLLFIWFWFLLRTFKYLEICSLKSKIMNKAIKIIMNWTINVAIKLLMTDKQCKIGCILSYVWTYYYSVCKSNLIGFIFKFKKLLSWSNFMSKNHCRYFSTPWMICLNSVTLWNCEYLKTKNFLRLYKIIDTIQ